MDFILLIIVALLGVGLTVVGGVVASNSLGVRLCFLIGGPLLVLCTIWQGARQMSAQRTSDEGFMHIVQENNKDRQRSNAKIDSLFALLQPQEKNTPIAPPTKPAKSVPKAVLPPNNGKLTVTQKLDVSTRDDAPYKTMVTIQSSVEFPSLKMLVQCDKPLVDATGGPNGMMVMTNQGLVPGHPNVYFLTYQSASPPFSPSNPVMLSMWSKEPVICNQVATY
jgi:hypothetical protein